MAAQATGEQRLPKPKGRRIEEQRAVSQPHAAPEVRLTDALDSLTFNKEIALALLFKLPIPPSPPTRGGKPYPTHTALGRVMRLKGLSIEDITRLPHPGIPNARWMSDYLAARRSMSPRHAKAVGAALGVDWRLFT